MGTWVVPGYVEERELGRGASGRVIAAVDIESDRCVAIKYLAPALFADPVFLAGFRDEAGILRTLDVPQVVRLFDYVEAPGVGAAIVMELIDGVSLHQLITRQGPSLAEPAFSYAGDISAMAAGTASYRWVYSSGPDGSVQTLHFTAAGTQQVPGGTVRTKTAASAGRSSSSWEPPGRRSRTRRPTGCCARSRAARRRPR